MAYTGKVKVLDQDGLAHEVWCEAGLIVVEQDAPFMVVPQPEDGHAWAQVELQQRGKRSDVEMAR